MDAAIEMRNLTQKFSEKCVLDNVNLHVRQGEIFGLLGPSGAGKTTMVKIITGQLKQTAGEVLLFGRDTRQPGRENCREIGAMMDNLGLYERLSVYDNLKFYTEIYRVPKQKADSVLKQVGLYEARNTAAGRLSKGMKSRLCFARAVLNDARLLFLDEPTSGLDPMTARDIHGMLAEQKERGATIFLTTHNMFEAENICDNIALLNQGKIMEYGAPREICRKYDHLNRLQIRLKDGSTCELEKGRRAAEEVRGFLAEDMLETIHSTEPNLESVFIELTGRGFE